MSNVAPILHFNQGQTLSYLGPATLAAVDTLGVTLRLRDGTTTPATVALASPYQPTPGDTVLAIGSADGFYVIGIIDAQAAAKMVFPGDVELSAGGSLRIHAVDEIELCGQNVTVRASKLEMAAREVVQRFDKLRQRVVDLLSVQAGTTHTVVEGSSYKQAQSATLLTQEKVSINGKTIHLG